MQNSASASTATQPHANATGATGGTPICIAIIWLKSSGSAEERADILKTVKGYQGVLDARISAGRPDVIMVDYQQGSVRPSEIIGLIRDDGHNAMQVGC
jgi:hypothetical protein